MTPEPEWSFKAERMEMPVVLVKTIRWILTSSSSLPEERIAAVDAIDMALADHEASKENPLT